jgi:nucleoside-diphosphate-sugar epimerase
MNAQKIEGAVALVTGANRGIGRALTEALLTRGREDGLCRRAHPSGAQGASIFGVYAGPVDTDMVRELALPKTSPRDVAFAILEGVEAGQEDIFPDAYAVEFGRQFGSSPKASERQIAAMTAAMLASSAA